MGVFIMQNSFGLNDIVLKQIIDLAQKRNIIKVILFGSRARGDFKKKSDIDLAVLGQNIAEFSFDVDELTDTLLKYDIIDLNSNISDELLKNIQNEGIIIYEKIWKLLQGSK